MSGFIPKRVLNARIGTTIEKNQTPMEAGLAPRIGKSGASIRLYYQRVDECFCPQQCPPLVITDSIIWFPYNNSLDSQGNSLPQRSNYIAIQFNRRLTANPTPAPPFTWTITGDACISGPPAGGYTGNSPPLSTISQNGQRIYFNPNPSPGPFGQYPFELSIDAPGNPYIALPLSTRISPSEVFLMDDLQFVGAQGLAPQIQAPGQWLVFVVGFGPNSNPINGPIPEYETFGNTGNTVDNGGIENNPNAQVDIKVNYNPDASGLNPGPPSSPATFPDPGPLLYTDDCNGFSAPLGGFSSNYLSFVRKTP